MTLYSATYHQDKEARRMAALEAQLRISHPFRRPATTKSAAKSTPKPATRSTTATAVRSAPRTSNTPIARPASDLARDHKMEIDRLQAEHQATLAAMTEKLHAAHDHVLELAHRVLRRDDTIAALREKLERRVARKEAEVQHLKMHLVDANAVIAENKTTIAELNEQLIKTETVLADTVAQKDGTIAQLSEQVTSLKAQAAGTSNDALGAANERAIQLAHRVLRRDDTITALREKMERRLARKEAQVQHIKMHLVDADATIAKNKTTISELQTWVKSLETQIHAAIASNDSLLATLQQPTRASLWSNGPPHSTDDLDSLASSEMEPLAEPSSCVSPTYPINSVRQLVNATSNYNSQGEATCQTHWIYNN
ncbi:hypothetical protein SDRG_01761 [Saprolegnia diclina VS20]|uniref:Uncharacterized protein n=1 Tax=Saprolegnia diclina (strain VS20) TaxID=1156394 RepID=T0QRC1_SAPDV|nr:hypothetical protein SDRG_01761 [Saprolegnia diclina VS20]EQC40684.1 hypothetical protein SDRG_01761 [Saprolegnia diclina VS20]|eukprot:XP_008605528.1 hypothetical protein SDRG_01761 [Saprolegnia diclina VS20]